MKNLRTRSLDSILGVFLVASLTGASPLEAQDAAALRALLDARVGGIEKLRVPSDDADLPQPRHEDGAVDPRFAITPEKAYLGKLLFFDPLRSTDIRTEFGGIPETAQTASCGSCHLGEAASKAGARIAVGVGGEGRHEMDASGEITISRGVTAGLTDVLPTPVEMTDGNGGVIASGRFDAVDAPGRVAPSCIGFAYNTRLLWGGEAGEPNPEGYPAQEDIVRLASMGHRMASPDFSHLQENAVYRRLFEDAFPEEYQTSLASGDLDDLINLDTQFRAIAAFLRTVITRETPWDRFLSGDDSALSPRQERGAWLFTAEVGEGGANCISCHSGPALNKQLGDEDGLLVGENFHNLGTAEHPLVALARETTGDPDFHDVGRIGVTGDAADAYAFKSPTLRQLKDAAPYFHGGQAQTLREVVEYFNLGVPFDPLAGAAGSLSPRFTNPAGGDSSGLNLSEEDVDALVEFLENGLYDPGFAVYDSSSPTRVFEPTMYDLTYSEELKTLGAVDGWLPSGLPNGVNDEKSRQQLIFVRGRCNRDDTIDISDTVFVLDYLFRGGPAPRPMAAADVNNDDTVNIADPIYLLGHLFTGGAPPPLPYPALGQDLVR